MLEVQFNISPAQVQIPTVQESKPELSMSIQAFTLLQNARILKAHNENKLALALLRQASNLQNHPKILAELTETLVQITNWNEAYKVAKHWCQIDSQFKSYFFLAQIEYQLGFDEKSLQNYYESLALVDDQCPELFEVFKNMGNLFVRKADFESAEEFYNKAYVLRMDSDILLVNYGILEMQRSDLNKAKERFRSAVQINPKNDKAWVGLSMVHFEFGDEELGVANLKKAIDHAPFNRTAIQLALQKMSQVKYREYLIEVISHYMSEVESDQEMSCRLIELFYQQGRIELAYLESQRLLLWNPENEEYYRISEQLEKQLYPTAGGIRAVG